MKHPYRNTLLHKLKMRTCFPKKTINLEKNATHGMQNQVMPSFTEAFPQNDSQIQRRCTVLYRYCSSLPLFDFSNRPEEHQQDTSLHSETTCGKSGLVFDPLP